MSGLMAYARQHMAMLEAAELSGSACQFEAETAAAPAGMLKIGNTVCDFRQMLLCKMTRPWNLSRFDPPYGTALMRSFLLKVDSQEGADESSF